MSVENVHELLVEELKDIYDAEHRLTKALPKLAKEATDPKLVSAFEKHLKETEAQITRLETIFKALDETPKRKTCKAMVGLLAEGQEMMEEEAPPHIKDLMLIAAAQKVEHYEIATYGCLRTWAEMIGDDRIAKTLQKNLDEETAADETLTTVARTIDQVEMEEEGQEELVPARRPAPKGNSARSSR